MLHLKRQRSPFAAALPFFIAFGRCLAADDFPRYEEGEGQAEGSSDASQCNSPPRQAEVSGIIHTASALAAIADGSLAQFPGAGALVIPVIQAGMIYGIGEVYGCYWDLKTALMVGTYLASDHVKKAFVKELLGWTPMVGNIIKGSVTLFMTEGIGNVANNLLQCGKGPDDLVQAALASGGSVQEEGKFGGQLFHLITDYLVNVNRASQTADDVWLRIKSLLTQQDTAHIVAAIEEAAGEANTEEVVRLVRRHVWNLVVVEAALRVLESKFARPEACAVVDIIADGLWNGASADAEARLVAAPYLLHCLVDAAPQTRKDVVRAAAELVARTRGGTRGGASLPAVRAALQILERGLQDEPVPVALEVEDLANFASGALSALSGGEAAACPALRALLAATPRSAPWLGIWHMRKFGRMRAPPGAEVCVSALRSDMISHMTLNDIPSSAELPCSNSECFDSLRDERVEARPRIASMGAVELEQALSKKIVGQRCALERLVQHPGHVRLRLAGMSRKDKPLVLLLTGPSGTGKTLLAQTLAEVLLRRPFQQLEGEGKFRTFHMNLMTHLEDQKSFFGPPKGIVGVGDLPELLKAHPDAVVLLDEVEKAHPSFARSLLKVFGEHGAVYDPSTGEDVKSTRATFILTSNLGKDFISTHAAARGKINGDPDCIQYSKLQDDVKEKLKESHVDGRPNFFSESELRGRLTDTLPFLPFTPLEVEAGVRQHLSEASRSFQQAPEFQYTSLAWEPEVVPVFASSYVGRVEEGLRGVVGQMDPLVREALESGISSGLLEGGGVALLRVNAHGIDTNRLDLRAIAPWSLIGSRWPRLGGLGGSAPPPHSGPASTWNWIQEDAVATMSKWLDFSKYGLSGPGATMGMRSGDVEWERAHKWDWSRTWQHIWDQLWKYKFHLAFCLALLFVGISTTFAPALTPATGVASLAGATAPGGAAVQLPAVAAMSSTLSGALWFAQAGLQTAQVAVPVVIGAYAWGHRDKIAAFLFSVLGLVSARLAWWLWRKLAPPDRGKRKRATSSCRGYTAQRGHAPRTTAQEQRGMRLRRAKEIAARASPRSSDEEAYSQDDSAWVKALHRDDAPSPARSCGLRECTLAEYESVNGDDQK